MHNHNIAIIDPTKSYARALAKKGTETDYTIYNYKEGENILCLYEPHAYPDKIQSLLHCLYLSDYVVWVVDAINADFAEVALALMLSGKNGLLILHGPDEGEISPILAKTPLWKWARMNQPNTNDLRATLLGKEPERSATAGQEKLAVVDASFSVGGVGTVVLTKIESGTFSIHDEFEVTPSRKVSAIRSIQVQDVDVKEAPEGSRAGFALKNIAAEEIKRGSYLAPAGTVSVFAGGQAVLEVSGLVKEPVESDGEYFFSFGMQYAAAKIMTDKPIGAKDGPTQVPFSLVVEGAAREGQAFLMVRPSKRPRIIASGVFKKLG
ncbi:MAG: EF-Tu/IF-2/RF-3 family GTPase [Candidatus Micrarchaeota archaeon]